MSLIEGVGDEVVHFAALALVLAMAMVAWMSTNARPDRYRTLLLMRSHATHPVSVSIRTGVTVTSSPSPESQILDSGAVIPLQEMDSIVDADMALFDNNRLHFYRRVDPGPNSRHETDSGSEGRDSGEESEPASREQIREMDSIVSAMEADVTPYTHTETGPTAPTIERVTEEKEPEPAREGPAEGAAEPAAGGDSPHGKKILIRLKYLNDTLREVEGSLDEPLKDFMWRHFHGELSAQSRVRLIHRGRVLADDGASLRALGLTHRDIVHALVHPLQAQPPPPAPAAARAERPAERGWDLENILMTLVSVALTVVWFFRCEYSNMFTASASVALFGLTVFYSVAIFGLYISDTFTFDRRQVHPIPNI